MSESMQAWIFLIGLIVFFIVLLIVTLVVLFGGNKDADDQEDVKKTKRQSEERKVETKKPDTQKTENKKTEAEKTETKKVEDKKTDSKKADYKKADSKKAGDEKIDSIKLDSVADTYDDGYDNEYYDEFDDGYYDEYDYEYKGEEGGKTDELKNPDAPAKDEYDSASAFDEEPLPEEAAAEDSLDAAPVEKPAKSKKESKKEAKRKEKQLADNDDIFTAAMDEDSIISRIEGDNPEQFTEDEAQEEDIPKDIYWYNKEEVAERPSYRKPEDYYHYFRSAFDSLDELLTEMYDCAYVKTEEIRFIAYGIEPKTIFGNEDLLIDEDSFIEKFKTKKPSMQDGVKIYEKWCGYVEKFLEIIEFHASNEMIEDIKKKLCEYGKSDVNTLIKGR